MESVPTTSRALDPQSWIEMVTAQATKGDMFSARTLMTIHEGVDQLARAQAAGGHINITNLHAHLFERLQRSFNNPNLLKEVGLAYLEQFRMPTIALRHFEIAHQFAPKDRMIEELQAAAALAVAREKTDATGHSGITEAPASNPEVGAVLRKTCQIGNVAESRSNLTETTARLVRKTGAVGTLSKETVARFNEALDRADVLASRRDFAGANAAVEEARQAGAPKADVLAAYAQYGLAAYDQGRMDDALDAFLKMRELSPDAVEGWFNCGLVHQKMGQVKKALESYRRASEIAPENPKTWCNLSSVCFEHGDLAESEQAARRAIELKSDYARAWDNLAAALSAQNRLPEAAAACQKAVELHTGLHSAWFKLGVINFQLDNLVVASAAFNMVVDSADFAAYVHYYLSMIESRRGEIEKATVKLEQGRAMDLGNELERTAAREIALALTKMGDHEGAAAIYREMVERRPDDFSSWLALGTAHYRAGQTDEARVAYLRATEVKPEHPVPWHNLGLIASDQGNHAESRDFFRREVDLAPNDPKAWYDLGVSLEKLGLEEESAEAFEHAQALVKSLERRSTDLSAAMSIVHRLNLSGRMLRIEIEE